MMDLGYKKPTIEQTMRIEGLERDIMSGDLRKMLNLPSYEDDNHNAEKDHQVEIDFLLIAGILDKLQTAKNVHYHNSYSKHGISGIFFNTDRKFSRFQDSIMSGKTPEAGAGETFIDTVGDLAAYALKAVAWIATRRPDLYLSLLEGIKREMEGAKTWPITYVVKPDSDPHKSMLQVIETEVPRCPVCQEFMVHDKNQKMQGNDEWYCVNYAGCSKFHSQQS